MERRIRINKLIFFHKKWARLLERLRFFVSFTYCHSLNSGNRGNVLPSVKKGKKEGLHMEAIQEHINCLAIHKLMNQLQRYFDIPPCNNLADYLAMLQVCGLVSSSQADGIREYYTH